MRTQEEAVHLLLALGRVYCQAGAYAAALPHLLSAQLHARQYSLHVLAAAIAVQMADATLALNPQSKDQVLADTAALLPAVLAQGDTALQAQVKLQVLCMPFTRGRTPCSSLQLPSLTSAG